jgi:hypothetical protein
MEQLYVNLQCFTTVVVVVVVVGTQDNRRYQGLTGRARNERKLREFFGSLAPLVYTCGPP